MEFPVLHGKQHNFPDVSDPVCPVCKLKNVWGSNEYVELSCGSQIENAQTIESDLWLDWFSNKDSNGVQAQAELAIASEVSSSRLQFAFCSTDCLRKFLNTAVDSLECKIHETKNS